MYPVLTTTFIGAYEDYMLYYKLYIKNKYLNMVIILIYNFMKYLIYKITNNINQKIYIGFHKTKNINDKYMGSGLHIKRVIKKYGKNNFTKEILFIFDNEIDMFLKEAELVTEEFVKLDSNYNLTPGGNISPFNYKIMVKDKDNNNYWVDKNDPKYLSGELISFNKNKIVVQDIHGQTYQVYVDDPKYISGELFSCCKNKITVKNKFGQNFNVDKNDPLIGIEYFTIASLNKGVKRTPEQCEKMKQNQVHRFGNLNPCYGKKGIYHPILNKTKFVFENEIEIYINEGWIVGSKYKGKKLKKS